MYLANRRFTLRLLAGSALAGALPYSASAQEDIVVPNSLENIKRGTIHTLDPKTRGFVIVWEDLGRVKMKAATQVFPKRSVCRTLRPLRSISEKSPTV